MFSQIPLNTPDQRLRKRLIVLCDGTWEDSTSDDEVQYPSNVTRISRAISPYAAITHPDGSEEIVEQIIYYQKGVGTGVLDTLLGGATGLGVSANVRAAYGFLAHNYQPGDSIYFFGFSRGAYTARSIAGLVTSCGLLTKKGMDSFQILYNKYYKDHGNGVGKYTDEDRSLFRKLESNGLLVPQARDAVEIVGVFDTVAFHHPSVSRTLLAKLLGITPENIEFHNTEISPRVKYGFHALALDETRRAYLPTLWHKPSDSPASRMRQQELVQVWFSGNHTDIGGGKFDHRLSDVSLAWMIAQCDRTGLLAFEDNYLVDTTTRPLPPQPWSVAKGATKNDKSFFWSVVNGITRNWPLISVARSPLSEQHTNEAIHCSIADRRFGANTGAAGSHRYPCRSLGGKCIEKGSFRQWVVGNSGLALNELSALQKEEFYKGRIRTASNDCVGVGNRK